MLKNRTATYQIVPQYVTLTLFLLIIGIPFELSICIMKINNSKIKTIAISALVFLFFYCGQTLANTNSTINGQILDNQDKPIIGASVLIMDLDKIIIGIATDDNGNFKITYLENDSATLKIQAIGYKLYTMQISNFKQFTIHLQEDIIEIAPISVTSSISESAESEVMTQKQFKQRTKNSILTNNPINAIRQPQLVKQGSSLSSKLRINGTSPAYFYHNLPIGNDPNHYGMFSIIPSSVVSSVTFYPNGTPAAYQLPSVIDLVPKKQFNMTNSKSIEFSLVQTTGTYSYATENYYTIGSIRKSVLDKLIKYVDIKSNRQTIPPTNFEDIVISSGYKINAKSTLYLDQFYTRDFLAYNTGPTSNNKAGLNTFQHTKTAFFGLTYQYNGNNFLLNAKLSSQKQSEEFTATPPYENLHGLDLKLSESTNQYNGKFSYTRFFSLFDISSGAELNYIPKRLTNLVQINWNHKSPDATSNNPFVFQYEINQLFNNVSLQQKDIFAAAYTQFSYENKKIKLNFGIRYEQFSKLKENKQFLFRNRITYQFESGTKISLFAGTFSENPIKRILENYQVLARIYQSELTPQKTKLFSLAYHKNNIKISMFSKRIDQIATPNIDYSKVTSKKQVTDGFIVMRSTGTLDFIGGDISYEKENFISSKINLYTFYGFTKATKKSNGNTSLYELNAPHKFLAELMYMHSDKISFGTEFNYHSGFAYTPYIEQQNYTKDERYKDSYYQHIQSFDNSERFPAYYSLNIFLNLAFGDKELNFSVSNITNRGNPVIHTSDGYIYDPGVMPSIGFNWKL